MPKVSVIVPVYNVEKFLVRCLDSLVSQTLEDIEIICVNDGSTDKSSDIIKEYAEKDGRIKVLEQVNMGVSCSRNAGLKVSTGEFIAFVDSDDFVEKEFYEKLYNTAKQEGAEVACAGIIRENFSKSRELIKYDEIAVCNRINDKFNAAKAPEYCFVWNKIYLASKFKELGLSFIKGILYEDLPFMADVLTKMGRLVCVPKVQYHYWINNASIIKNSKSDKARADKIFAKKYFIDKCFEYGVKLREKDYLLCKREIYFAGLKLLKIYQYRATKKVYLFGLIPFLTIKEYV